MVSTVSFVGYVRTLLMLQTVNKCEICFHSFLCIKTAKQKDKTFTRPAQKRYVLSLNLSYSYHARSCLYFNPWKVTLHQCRVNSRDIEMFHGQDSISSTFVFFSLRECQPREIFTKRNTAAFTPDEVLFSPWRSLKFMSLVCATLSLF